MPSLIDIRRRVRAVKSTQQITKAMKMVSTSKLRRAQERIVRSRPYANEMLRIFNDLASRVDSTAHPLLQNDPEQARTLLIVITGDRGLAGSFSMNVVKAAMNQMADVSKDPMREVALALVGRKGRDYFQRRGFDVKYEEVGLFQNLKWSNAQAIARTAIDEFKGPDISRVYLVYNEFKSVISQRVVIEQLLPIPRLNAEPSAATASVDYLFEPSAEELLETLLPFHVAVQIARALLESAAAEHAARMRRWTVRRGTRRTWSIASPCT
jgi:F-type H+-transporting ATPase subunit gamma